MMHSDYPFIFPSLGFWSSQISSLQKKKKKKKNIFLYSLCMCQIGSSPGFEDGAFESAKLVRPAASFYHAVDDCLYFVDSEVYFWNLLNS